MLLRRGKNYYCRLWVPLELRKLIGRNELKKSLGTTDRKEAKAAAAALIHKTETAFFRVRVGMLTTNQLEQITANILEDFGGKTEAHRAELKDAYDFLCNPPQGLNPNTTDPEFIARTYAKRRTPEDIAYAADGYTTRINHLQQERNTLNFSDETYRHAQTVIEQNNLQIVTPCPAWFDPNGVERFNEPDDDFLKVCRAIVDGLIDAYGLEQLKLQGKTDRVLEADIQARIESATPKPKITDLWAAYCKTKHTKGRWNAKTAKKNQDTFDEAVQLIGNKELAGYSQNTALDYLTALEKSGNSAATRTGKVEMLSSLFKFALKTPESIDLWKVRGNPFADMQVTDAKPVNGKKIPYTSSDLQGLLSGLLKVRKLVEPHRFWVPLIALYSGMRQNEVCQLRCADIVEEDGVHVFKIRHNPALLQTVKARNVRTCPVHPMLKRLGFIDYLEQQRKANIDRVFSKLTYTEGKGWCGRIRGWWNETYQGKYVADTSSKSFHSLRGTFVDWFKQNKAYDTPSDRSVVQSMIGHDGDDSITSKHYEQNFPAKTQLAMLKKLDYGLAPDLIEKLINKEY